MPLWIPITLAAAFLQNARSAAQAHLKGAIGQDGAVFVRFGYGAPFALLYALALGAFVEAWPAPTLAWAGYGFLGATTQIAATYALLLSFDDSGFAVGTAYSKTEPIQAALFGAILLGEAPTWGAVGAILLGVVGVLVLSGVSREKLAGARRGVALGLLAGALFGISAVSFRAASISLDPEAGFLVKAGVTLAAATLFQALAMGAWLAAFRPGELGRVGRAYVWGGAAGLAGAAASAGWFTAMTLEPAAHVRALAQVELVFTFAASVFFFREAPKLRDALGVVIVATAVVLLLIAI